MSGSLRVITSCSVLTLALASGAAGEAPAPVTPTPPVVASAVPAAKPHLLPALEADNYAGWTDNHGYVVGPPACRTTCEQQLDETERAAAAVQTAILKKHGRQGLFALSEHEMIAAISKEPALLDEINAAVLADAEIRKQADEFGACIAS